MAETRHWCAETRRTVHARHKETGCAYRFMSDPDLPVLHVTPQDMAWCRETMPVPLRVRHARVFDQAKGTEEDSKDAPTAKREPWVDGLVAHVDRGVMRAWQDDGGLTKERWASLLERPNALTFYLKVRRGTANAHAGSPHPA